MLVLYLCYPNNPGSCGLPYEDALQNARDHTSRAGELCSPLIGDLESTVCLKIPCPRPAVPLQYTTARGLLHSYFVEVLREDRTEQLGDELYESQLTGQFRDNPQRDARLGHIALRIVAEHLDKLDQWDNVLDMAVIHPDCAHSNLTCFLRIKECIKWALASELPSRCEWDMRFLSETGTAIVFYLRSLAALVARPARGYTVVVCPQGDMVDIVITHLKSVGEGVIVKDRLSKAPPLDGMAIATHARTVCVIPSSTPVERLADVQLQVSRIVALTHKLSESELLQGAVLRCARNLYAQCTSHMRDHVAFPDFMHLTIDKRSTLTP
jgi:hypothetical protein